MSFEVTPIGYIHSTLKFRRNAPRQGWKGGPDVRLQVLPQYVECLDGVAAGQDIWVFTWLHQADRETFKVHPGHDPANPITGVFATRSPDRPNPIGLHRSKVLSIDGDGWLQVEAIEAIDGTPVIDLKPVLEACADL